MPQGEPLASLAPQDIVSGPWKHFASRHAALHAAASTAAPTQIDPASQPKQHSIPAMLEENIEQFSQQSPDEIQDFSDEEAAMVERSASSVAESSVSSTHLLCTSRCTWVNVLSRSHFAQIASKPFVFCRSHGDLGTAQQ